MGGDGVKNGEERGVVGYRKIEDKRVDMENRG